jgi:hypothetical protein
VIVTFGHVQPFSFRAVTNATPNPITSITSASVSFLDSTPFHLNFLLLKNELTLLSTTIQVGFLLLSGFATTISSAVGLQLGF